MKATRCKLECEEIGKTRFGTKVVLQANYAKKSPENDAFFQATPSGNITLYIKSEVAAALFDVGKAYYVDFTPAPDE